MNFSFGVAKIAGSSIEDSRQLLVPAFEFDVAQSGVTSLGTKTLRSFVPVFGLVVA